MWIKSEIVDDVDRVARIWFISWDMAQAWNTKRREGELRMMTGWVWTSRDGKQERVAFRTMTAAYIVGAAAADGIEAALLARAEFTGAPLALEGRRGLAALMSTSLDTAALLEGLGETFVYTNLAVKVPATPPAEA